MDEIVIDANGLPIGRVAAKAAYILNGKQDIDFMPNKITSKRVKVINVGKVTFTGNKINQKKYYRHSGYSGAIKESSMLEMFESDPKKLFLKIIKGI
mgnify:CR=1 FL=1